MRAKKSAKKERKKKEKVRKRKYLDHLFPEETSPSLCPRGCTEVASKLAVFFPGIRGADAASLQGRTQQEARAQAVSAAAEALRLDPEMAPPLSSFHPK